MNLVPYVGPHVRVEESDAVDGLVIAIAAPADEPDIA